MKTLCLHLLILSALVVPITARACSCLKPQAKDLLKYADIAFRGELVEHKGGLAVFRVDEWWKGNPGRSVEFEWRDGSHGDCNGFWPKLLHVGGKLLMFGTRDSRGIYHADICLPQEFVSDSEKDLRELGPGTPPHKD